MADFVQELFTSRNNYPDGNTRIGQEGRLWYDSITNTIRIGDGATPGGIIVNSNAISSIPVFSSNVQLTPSVSSLNFTGNGVVASAVGDAVTVTVAVTGTINFDGGSPTQNYANGPAFDCGGVT